MKKPEGSKNTRKSEKVKCPSSFYSVSQLLSAADGKKVQFRRVNYSFQHNHALQDTKNLREMLKSKLLRNKIQALIERGKEIHEIQEELSTWRKQFISREGAQHLRRDDFVIRRRIPHLSKDHCIEVPETQGRVPVLSVVDEHPPTDCSVGGGQNALIARRAQRLGRIGWNLCNGAHVEQCTSTGILLPLQAMWMIVMVMMMTNGIIYTSRLSLWHPLTPLDPASHVV